jgi:hypothetical protein
MIGHTNQGENTMALTLFFYFFLSFAQGKTFPNIIEISGNYKLRENGERKFLGKLVVSKRTTNKTEYQGYVLVEDVSKSAYVRKAKLVFEFKNEKWKSQVSFEYSIYRFPYYDELQFAQESIPDEGQALIGLSYMDSGTSKMSFTKFVFE